MGSFNESFVQQLKRESWGLYAAGVFMILLRFYARARRLGGYAKFQIDDWLMHLVLGLYTATIVCLNVISQGGGSNLYDPAEEGPGSAHPFTDEETRERVYGSKIVVVSEQSMLNCVYAIKTCVLIMYTRLTLGLTAQRFVRYLACYVAVGWVATEVTFFAACRPFGGYWGMPPPDPQCTTYERYAIVQACFNISSDLMMLSVPLSLVFRLQLPWRRKIVLVFVFGLGIFVVMAALLTKIFNLSDVWSTQYMLWYIREASVAVYVANLPLIWPTLREWFPFLRGLNPAAHIGSTALPGPGGPGGGPGGNGSASSPHRRSVAGSGGLSSRFRTRCFGEKPGGVSLVDGLTSTSSTSSCGGGGCGDSSLPLSMADSGSYGRGSFEDVVLYRHKAEGCSLGSLESTIGLESALRDQRASAAAVTTTTGEGSDDAHSTENMITRPERVHVRGRPNGGGPLPEVAASNNNLAMGGIQVQTDVTVVEEAGLSVAQNGRAVFDWENAGRNRHKITVGVR